MSRVKGTEGYLIDEYFSKRVPKGNLVMDEWLKCPFSCTLNQTDIEKNNNKFYIMQLIEESGKYYLYIRYGRVGESGTMNEKTFPSKSNAISAFTTQFKSKTKNSWNDVHNFVRHKGKYYLINICDKIEDSLSDNGSDSEEYDFDEEVSYFLNLISDKKMLNRCLISMDIDTKKMPLGKINQSNINLARKVLQKISKSMKNPKELTELSSEYYTYIPYSCGRSEPPIINSKEMVAKLEDTLDYLENISINVEIQKRESGGSPLTKVYDSINTEIITLCNEDPDYNIIKRYLENSQGSTHLSRFRLELKQIYAIHRPEARARFEKKFGDTPNHQLLIHGSPICNWVSILKNGLMLDPSKLGVPITGKMFGYGIYWANSFSKSAQYCGGFWGNSGKRETICLTLAQVALGKEHKLKQGDWNMCTSRLNKGCSSVWGMGVNTPSSEETLYEEDIIVPNGVLKAKGPKDCALVYDEKIVYDPDQFDLRFMVVVEMIFR